MTEGGPDWADLTKRLLLCARYGVGKHAPEDRKRFDVACKSYVERAIKTADFDGEESASSLYRLLAETLLRLVADDERELDRIVDETPWNDIVPRVLAYTTKKHGPGRTRAGKDPDDRVQEAVSMLIERRHHFPHFRGVSLVAFLCRTVDGIVSHDAERMQNHGPHLSITQSGKKAERGEFSADRLQSVDRLDDPIADLRNERFIASLTPASLQEYARLCDAEPDWTAKQYAEALNTTESRVRNWNRMLKRRRLKFDRNDS